MSLRATYRIQFHRDFTFRDAAILAPYFKKLGISHLYASPILTARAGSNHGYDVVDHAHINLELGGEEEYCMLVAALRKQSLGIIVDIVPNHMAVGGADNAWWLDVLEKGPESAYAQNFDIDWCPSDEALRGKVVLPFLESDIEQALAENTLKLEEKRNGWAFTYGEHLFPLRLQDYDDAAHGKDLRVLLARQNYRLASWRDAGKCVNWRRFFDITTLAGLRVEDDLVFEAVHEKIFELYERNLIDGLRVDHVDGLADPGAYCRRLRQRLNEMAQKRPHAETPYLIVEKILAHEEALPETWLVDGTTGYDFMDEISAFQHDPENEKAFGDLWQEISGRTRDFEIEETAARREILSADFSGALSATARAFSVIGSREAEAKGIHEALTAIILRMRAYRSYADGRGAELGKPLIRAIEAAEEYPGPVSVQALAHVRAVLEGKYSSDQAQDAARRFNQLSAPVAAKAVEDTAFYRYGRLLSRNDVGFSPKQFAMTSADFHSRMEGRAGAMPFSMLATATHDHKRGEDVRARLAALSELAPEWRTETDRWVQLNASLRSPDIDAGDEYQLYQTLVGIWPAGMSSDDTKGIASIRTRLLAGCLKSLREAKLQTSWASPDEAFENANLKFIEAILDPAGSAPFLACLSAFANRVAVAGALNSLVQTTLHYTVPGIPDLYQGCELWDLSLVDPDNRRPVDFIERQKLLEAAPAVPSLANWQTGVPKIVLIASLLRMRAGDPDLLSLGRYVPLQARGGRKNSVLAFMRESERTRLIAIVPHLVARECLDVPLPSPSFWQDTEIMLPYASSGGGWHNVWGADASKELKETLAASEAFARFPACVLLNRKD